MNKKFLIFVFLALFLFGCQDKPFNVDDVFGIELIIFSNNEQFDNVTLDFRLVDKVDNIIINWDSSDSTHIRIEGNKAFVIRSNETKPVTLTASFTYKEQIYEKKFLVIIRQNELIDEVPPVISGVSSFEIEIGTEVDLLKGVNAIDDVDGEVEVYIYSNELNVNKVGRYKVIFAAKDKSGNISYLEIIITVTESIEDIDYAPVITGVGNTIIEIGDNLDFLDNAIAFDKEDGEVPVDIIENKVNIHIPGQYQVTFEAVDSFGNVSVLDIIVTVIGDAGIDLINEGFDNLPNASLSSYGDLVYENRGFKYEIYGVRRDQKLDGNAITFGGQNSDNSRLIVNFSGGINFFSVDLKKGFTNNNLRVIGLFINGNEVERFTLDNEDLDVQKFIVSNLNYTGDITLELRQLNTINTRAQIIIDNIVVKRAGNNNVSLEMRKLLDDYKGLEIEELLFETGNIHLPKSGGNGSDITWKYSYEDNSNNNLVNILSGEINLPKSGIAKVGLVAELVIGNNKLNKYFTLLIGDKDIITINDIYNLPNDTSVKVIGTVTNVLELVDKKLVFIQDLNKGIMIEVNKDFNISLGSKIEIKGNKVIKDNLIYLSNISDINVLEEGIVNVRQLTNQALINNVGMLVNITGLLKQSYDNNASSYTIVNKYGEFELVILDGLVNVDEIKSLFYNKNVGIEVDVFGVVYYHDGELKIYISKTEDIIISDLVDYNKIYEVIDSSLVFPFNNMEVSRDLTLFTSNNLFSGMTINWISNRENILSNTGKITQTDKDEIVILKYQIYINGNLIKEIELSIIILKKAQYSAYYSSISGLTGNDLMLELRKITSKMRNYSYTNTSNIIAIADLAIGYTNKVLTIYDERLVNSSWDGGSTWNKEHVWPQSKLGSASVSDMHNLRAATPSVNSSRGNKPFADSVGRYGAVGSGWYPGDASKGDVARIVLYMYVRWGLEIKKDVIGDLQVFLKWHLEDEVDEFELRRNEVLYIHQENRNPFIDHPELVELIFGKVETKVLEEKPTQVVLYNFLNVDINVDINYYDFDRKSSFVS